MSIVQDVLGLVDDVPPEVVRPVVALVGGIINVVRAGKDPVKRAEALMSTAERLKAELDDAKFGREG